MIKSASSPILNNVMVALLIIMVGWMIQMIRTPDPELAVLHVKLEGVRMDVVKLSGLIEDMRRGKISDWVE